MIVVAGTIQIDPAKTEEAMAAAVVMMAATHEEEGNEDYVFSLDPSTPGLIRVFEQWTSQEALDAHFATPHMAEFGAKIGGFGVTGMSINKYEIAGVSKLM